MYSYSKWLNIQEETVSTVKDVKGDWVLALKGNQKTFHRDIKYYLDDSNILKEIEKENYAEYVEKSNIQIIKSIQTWGVTEENRYFITSLKDDTYSFADTVRKHWGSRK